MPSSGQGPISIPSTVINFPENHHQSCREKASLTRDFVTTVPILIADQTTCCCVTSMISRYSSYGIVTRKCNFTNVSSVIRETFPSFLEVKISSMQNLSVLAEVPSVCPHKEHKNSLQNGCEPRSSRQQKKKVANLGLLRILPWC